MDTFILIGKQLLIVFLILAMLPLACRLLWRLRLLPLAVYLAATHLFFPTWAAEHELLRLGLFAACILFSVLSWGWKLHRRKQEQQFWETLILSRPSTQYWPLPEETGDPE